MIINRGGEIVRNSVLEVGEGAEGRLPHVDVRLILTAGSSVVNFVPGDIGLRAGVPLERHLAGLDVRRQEKEKCQEKEEGANRWPEAGGAEAVNQPVGAMLPEMEMGGP